MDRGLFRLIFVGALGLAGAGITARNADTIYDLLKGPSGPTPPVLAVSLGLVGFVLSAGLAAFLLWAWRKAHDGWGESTAGDQTTIFIGIFAGIVVASPILLLFSTLGAIVAPAATVITLVASSTIMIFALRSMRDILPWYKDDRMKRRTGLKILDTNTLIDGRIYDVLQSGFLEGDLYVPKFVLEELQHIADSADALRRQRGKRGLDILRLIENQTSLDVGSKDHLLGTGWQEVDSKLVRLALAIGGDLVTNDMNLNQVARLQKVRVLNLNDLALAMKPNVLPNEKLTLLISREGSQVNQGVGFLDDGTMVVVEGGRPHLNETIEVKVSQIIQTDRGKMIFAEAPDYEARPPRRHGR